jgi:hypothetical protein
MKLRIDASGRKRRARQESPGLQGRICRPPALGTGLRKTGPAIATLSGRPFPFWEVEPDANDEYNWKYNR